MIRKFNQVLFISIISLILFTPKVNAMTFKNGNKVYVLEERSIECVKDYYILGIDKNYDLIFMNNAATTMLDIIKVDKNNKCIDLTTQEKFDFLNEPAIYYDLYGRGQMGDTENENYYLIEEKYHIEMGGYIKTADTKVIENKEYYIYNNEYNFMQPVQSPVDSELNTYYESQLFTFPTSTVIDNNLTYYEIENNYFYQKVENPTPENIENYYLLLDESRDTTKKLEVEINQSKFDTLLEDYGYNLIVKDKEMDKFYIGVITDVIDKTDSVEILTAVYTPDGTLIEPFQNIYDIQTYHNSLLGITDKDGLKIYNNNYELLYSNENISYLTEGAYNNGTYYMLSWNPKTNKETIYTMIMYEVTSGENQIYKNSDLTITTNGELSKLNAVKVNGEVLDKKHYELETGSTIITLKKSYLETLSEGTYTLKLEYTDGGYTETTFKISASLINNPQTFDGIVNTIIISIISVIGLLLSVIYLRKNAKN